MPEEMSEKASGQMSPEQIRLRERRSFDAFNEAQAKRRQISRDRGAIQDAGEKERWVKHEAEPDGTGEPAANNSPGGSMEQQPK